jgi:multiple sugar transport system substrate-binding protein
MLKEHNLDLKKFIPSGLDMVKLYSGNGTLTTLPFTMGFRTMYYNRDLLDKFGAPYPAAHASWEQTIELAKKVTRVNGGTQYFGLSLNGAQYLPIKNEARADFVDSKTNKSNVNTDGWKRVFDLTRQVYQIPGNEGSFKGANAIFMKDKRLAMLVASNELRNMVDINWDVTAIPTLKESPRIGGYSQAVGLSISATSKHKEAAFLFIANTISDEVQLEMARNSRPSPLTDKKFVDAFGKGMKNDEDFSSGTVGNAPANWTVTADASTSGTVQLDGGDKHLKLDDNNASGHVTAVKSFTDQEGYTVSARMTSKCRRQGTGIRSP